MSKHFLPGRARLLSVPPGVDVPSRERVSHREKNKKGDGGGKKIILGMELPIATGGVSLSFRPQHLEGKGGKGHSRGKGKEQGGDGTTRQITKRDLDP